MHEMMKSISKKQDIIQLNTLNKKKLTENPEEKEKRVCFYVF